MRKITCLIVLLLLIVQSSFAQDKNSRVKITNPSERTIQNIALQGIDLSCGAKHEGEDLIIELSETEINSLRQNNINFTIEIDDLQQFYSKRAERNLPIANAQLEAAKASARANAAQRSSISSVLMDNIIQYTGCDEIDFVEPQNFNLGTMAGCLRYSEMKSELDDMYTYSQTNGLDIVSQKANASSTGQKTWGNPTNNFVNQQNNGPATYSGVGSTRWDPETIWYVRITGNQSTAPEGSKPQMLFTSMIHSREVSALMNNIYFMWYIIENYDTDPAIQELVDNNELYFVPVVNPDGLRWNETIAPSGGGLQRKNLRPNTGGTGTNRGVDLNRNFDYFWGFNNIGSSGTQTASNYRGPAPESEPETQIMVDFITSRSIKSGVWNHSYANSVPHPYGGIPTQATDREDEYYRWHEEMTRYNRYLYGATIFYESNGLPDDWMMGGAPDNNGSTGSGQGIIATTPEHGGQGFWPTPSTIVPIAKQSMRISLGTAYYGGKYAKLHDLTQSNISTTSNVDLDFGIERIGQTPSDFTVTVTPISSNIVSISSPPTESGIPIQTTTIPSNQNQRTVTATMQLNPAITANEKIEYNVTLSNDDGVIYEANYEKYYQPTLLFDHDPDATGLTGWTQVGGWNNTSSDAYSGTDALSTGTYSTNATKTLTTTNSYDFSNSNEVLIQFYSKWDIERNYDFVEILGSPDGGSSWISLCGNYTKPNATSSTTGHDNKSGTYANFQANSSGQIYDGDRMDNWVMEEIVIDNTYASLLSSNDVRIRFRFRTDALNVNENYTTTNDGFFIDDFKIISVQIPCLTTTPTNIGITNITSITAQVDWDEVPSATYDIRYRVTGSGAGAWTTITDIPTNSYQISGLSPLTDYDVQVRTRCATSTSSYSTIENFTTLATVPCTGTAISTFPYSESFENTFGLWTNDTGDDFNWTNKIEEGDGNSTPSANTGPSLAADGSYFLFIEASNPNFPTKTARLLSPCLDFSGRENAALAFDYHMFGGFTGDLFVEVSLDNGANYSPLNAYTLSGQQNTGHTDPWKTQNVDLSAYDNSIIKLRFTAVTSSDAGTGWQGDISIDNFSITSDEITGSAPPTAVCQNITVQLDNTGNATIVATDVDGGSTDDVAITNFSIDINTFDCTNIGTPVDVTLTVTDIDNQTDICIATVTVQDQVDPEFVNVPGNISLTCGNNQPTWTDPTATDNCDTTLTVTRTDGTGLNSGDIFPNGTTIISYSVTDDSGNINTASFNVNVVVDNQDPIAVCQNITVQLDNGGNISITASQINNGSSDNCGVASISASQTSFTCLNIGTNNVTLTVTDTSGNTDTCVAVVTIEDTTAPSITDVADITIECDASTDPTNTGAATATDNCDAAPAVTFSDVTAGNTITRTWTATDNATNTASSVQIITLEDTTAPVINCGNNITVNIDSGLCSATVTVPQPSATDNCATSFTFTATRFDSNGDEEIGLGINDPFPIGETTVVWTTDDGFNPATPCPIVITVLDNQAPSITDVADITIECDASTDPTNTGAATATDNCDAAPAVTFSDVTAGNTITRTWTATDNATNTASSVQIITLEDTTAPVINCGNNITVNIDSGLCSATVTVPQPSATDNCATSFTFTATRFDSNGDEEIGLGINDPFPIGETTVVWTTDDGFNPATPCPIVITVLDNQAPSIADVADITIECDASTDPTNTGAATATDNCDAAPAVTFSDVTAGNTITRTWTATDNATNTASSVQIITLEDTTAPSITDVADITIECDASTDPTNTGAATATDNCDAAPAVTFSDVTAGNTITRTWTATDNATNTASSVQIITLEDTTAPSITDVADITIECDASTDPTNTGAATATDNCDAAPAVTFSDVTAGNTITRTWTATDNATNTASSVQIITLEDTTAPSITDVADITIECDASTDPTNTGAATATDNCDAAPAVTFSDVTAGNTITRTWTATDNATNTASSVQIITLEDTTAPSITDVADITIECDASTDPTNTGAATATDNCDAAPAVTFSDVTAGNTITRTWTATDNATNTASSVQIITLEDTTAPSITDVADITIECDASTDPTNTGAATATDNCDAAPAVTFSDVTAGNTITRTWTATDNATNTASSVQIITLEDTTAPSITDVADITIECDASTDPTNTGAATATDNCDAAPAVTFSDVTAGNTITRTWTATDNATNTASSVQIITLEDTTAPVINCGNNITVNIDSGLCSATVTVPQPSATDNCATSFTFTATRFDSNGDEEIGLGINDPFPIGETTVVWTTDDGFNPATPCPIVITVLDNQAPSIADVADITIECDASTDPTNTGAATATDNCDAAPAVTFSDVTAGNTITRTWTATDNATNTASSVQIITLEDTTAPSITDVADITIECDASTDPTNTGAATATDNCDAAPAVTFSDVTAGNTITRTWTATDNATNTASSVQIITLEDTTAPSITDVADITIECDASTDPTNTGAATATDNCDAAPAVTFSDVTAGNTITRTWTATDNATNTASSVQIITLEDTTAPSITDVADITIECDASTDPTNTGAATATDNCDAAPAVTFSDVTAGNTITRTWTATDNATNTASSVQIITLEDTTAPSITDVADITIECDASTDPTNTGAATATDNCDAAPAVTFSDVTAGNTITRTWTATDNATNTASSVQIITLEDTTAPSITDVADITIECDASTDPTNTGAATATDNCDAAPAVTFSDVTAGNTITRTWTATDNATNTASSVQIITLEDTTAPSITDVADITIECDASTDPTNTGAATATDNCDAAPAVTFSDVTAGNTITRTWTATDNATNTASSVQIITLEDTTAPSITDVADITIECDASTDPTNTGAATATDNCDAAPAVTFSDVTAGNTITRTWTATDNATNTASSVQIITLEDTTAPSITDVADITIECDASTDPTNTGAATATDNCDAAPAVTFSDVTAGNTITRTWTATDNATNTASSVQIITLEDTTAPSITDVADITIECDASTDPTNTGAATATDNCDAAPAVTFSDVTAGNTITRTWTATDNATNTASSVQIITLEDTTAPSITDVADITIECDASTDPTNTGAATATDNCDAAPAVTFSDVTAGNTITRTWTATDNATNTASSVQIITLEDTTAPSITDVADITIECDASTDPTNTGAATATDNCDAAPAVTFSDVTAGNTITRTWTATDNATNTASSVQIITLEDTTAPSIADVADITIECDASTDPTNTGAATATDNCDAAPAVTFSDVTAGNTITRTWTATDNATNTASSVQIITLEDTTAPSITDVADITIECDASTDPTNTGAATATDNCDAAPAVTFSDVTAGNTITRTWTATDNATNTASSVQIITLEDTTAPSITDVADITIECDASTDPTNTGAATATDNCDAAPAVTFSDVTAGNTITRTWTATDNATNTASSVQIITLEDTTAPSITDVADITIECDASTDPTNTGAATATDNCDAAPAVTFSDVTAGNTITRTWTATDNATNTASSVQIITLEDTTAPSITDVADITIECDASTDPTNTGAATATDNCDAAPAVTFSDVTAGNTITRTWTATDNATNTASSVQIITLEDTTAPSITDVADITIECDASTDPTNTGAATATDNCDAAPAVTFSDVTAGNTITRTWTATDNATNTASSVQIITLEDTTAPSITDVADITIECDASTDPTNTGAATATDNCDAAPAVTFSDVTAGNTITRTWTATDNATNTASSVQIITLEDTTAPSITDVADITIECDASTDPTNTGAATATDNCDAAPAVTFSDVTAGNTITRTWTATDNATNTASSVQIITLEDTTAPSITDVADITIECDASTDPTNTGAATATDNCDAAPAVTFSDVTAGNTITRTWTATDNATNTASSVQIITLEDTTAPSITDVADITIECDASTDPTNTGAATATDNCDAAPAVTFSDVTAGNTITRTWTATDNATNTASSVQIITLEDTTAPTPNVINLTDISAECEVTSLTSPTAIDNCSGTVIVTNNATLPITSTTVVIWTYDDGNGNTVTQNQNVIINDVIAPICATQDISIELDGTGNATITPDQIDNGSSDNCSIASISVSPSSFTTSNLGTNSVTLTVTDSNGNSSDCTAIVTVTEETLSIGEVTNRDITIQPNPFNTSIKITLPLSLNGSAFNINIYDLNGRVVYKKTKSSIEGSIIINDLDRLEEAPYFIKISNTTSGIEVIKKLIKF
ncbi:Fibronectin type III domain-containing protein [Formosa sp. Hel1_31_208]|uniref:M14 family zinc carboxypeptidase n=1 Tax=Formosa sp. Hel1_31_208 TaxID=1798225 RepID=UPI00087BDB06|nr:M14 family zinc carboxypeptidase [Formosa sp. Hel1_31_208]SDS14311.1 Fibronectin type III domain-containing protein [Formosa sp. Hel1_31_208]